MSKNAIKTGRYTHELRSKNIMEVKKLQMQNGIESSIDSVYDTASVAIETEESRLDFLFQLAHARQGEVDEGIFIISTHSRFKFYFFSLSRCTWAQISKIQ